MPKELSAEQLRPKCDPIALGFRSTAELSPSESIIGQDRALTALKFGLNILKVGFNIYVSGPAGTGRTTAIKTFLEALAAKKDTPPDWCYVYNFRDPYSPRVLKLPPGKGRELQKDMRDVVDSAGRRIAQAFESKEYAERRAEVTQALDAQKEQAFSTLDRRARDKGFLLKVTPMGLVFVLAKEGKTISEEEYEKLSPQVKEQYARSQKELERELKDMSSKIRAAEKDVQRQIEDMNHEVASYSVSYLFQEVKDKYKQCPEVINYIKEVEQDIVDNFEQFITAAQPDKEPAAVLQELVRRQALRRYEVNALVDNSGLKGAPVILELNPTYSNLFGRIEREAQYGVLNTDFTMLKNGSVHRANGGYLVLRIEDILRNFMSWEGLKRALRDCKIAIEDVSEYFSFVVGKSLRPEPIPLDIKVVLVGEPLIYYLLYSLDPGFNELFKVKADFDYRMDKSEASLKDYAGVISRLCTQESLRHLDSSAVARLIEYSSRLAGDQGKLSTMFARIADIVREADFWASEASASNIEAAHVEKAIEQKVYRSNLIQERIQEMIQQGTIIIDTDGEKVGQVNGLAVIGLGDFSFGRPNRITASLGLGREGLVDIEREAKLGGPIHTKGVMILAGCLVDRYIQDVPLSLSARLVFEQSYEEVEGDSASSAELYALLSRLSDTPIRQGLAVTGSVNQRGEVQAIGGINEKIEGFFEVCRARGLNGKQGVLMPASNVRNLTLKEAVAEAVKEGKFHIYTVSTIDEGIEILTGLTAGQRLDDGTFEPDSVNDRVHKRLVALAQKLRDFTRPAEKGQNADNSRQ